MSSVSPTLSDIYNTMQQDMSDDHNVISVRYKYGQTTTQRTRDIVKEILTGKQHNVRSITYCLFCSKCTHMLIAVKVN